LADLVAVALSDFELAASEAAPVYETPATHTNRPVTTINAERLLALTIMANLPNCPAPESQQDPARCSQRGEKWESSGNSGQKGGNAQ
jgi:hypothetical protein